MNDLLLGLMILSGMLAFGFLFGGIMTFRDQDETENQKDLVLRAIDASFFLGITSTIHDVVKNWKKNSDGRMCIYFGSAFLAIAIGLGTLRTGS